MRMHRKSHLDERLASCAHILTMAELADKNMSTAKEVKEYLDFEKIFRNNNPVRLEIGCGKGKFVCETAKENRGVNFVACEKISNVLIDACERAIADGLENVYFLNCAAEVLEKYFPPHSVEQIYLNFSNPLPKEGYKKQRLTHPKFLNIYKNILTEKGSIVQKTDDRDFYLFSLESYRQSGYKITYTCEDLGANPVEGDKQTEHEILFISRGKKIYRIVAEV